MSGYVFKYKLTLGSDVISMPRGALPLDVGFQGEQLVLWAKVDPDRDTCPHEFASIPTGGSCPWDTSMYVGTVMVELENGPFVVHVFDLGER